MTVEHQYYQQQYHQEQPHDYELSQHAGNGPSTSNQPESSASNLQQQSEFATLTLDNTLEDLSSRFIVNLPAEELESMERVCFQIEQAHWYYEDFVRPAARNPSLLPSFSLKQFSLLMFKSCPLLDDLVSRHAEIWTSFMAYKERVPVCGAILISQSWDKVLLVKGYQKGASWSFPRGKINKDEPEGDCAIREVLEETGYDAYSHFPVDPSQQTDGLRNPYYVELVIKEQRIRLYFIPDVPESTVFETQTRKEISKIDWFKVDDLPTWKNGKKVQPVTTTKLPKYFMVTPFVSHLKLWIQKNKPKKSSRSQPTTKARAPEYPPHLQHVNVEYRASDSEDMGVYTETSESSGGEGGDADGEGESDEHHQFKTMEEGSLALEAFFFGAVSSSKASIKDLAPLHEPASTRFAPPSFDEPFPAFSVSTSPAAQVSPPLLAYERQQPLIQPRPKQTERQTSLLLALLTDLDPIASPPPERSSRDTSVSSLGPSVTQIQSSRLLNALRQPAASALTASTSHSIMFDHATPPIEARGFGKTRVLTDGELGASERLEKHSALLRALDKLASSPNQTQPSHGQMGPNELSTSQRIVSGRHLLDLLPLARSDPAERGADTTMAPRKGNANLLSILNQGRRENQNGGARRVEAEVALLHHPEADLTRQQPNRSNSEPPVNGHPTPSQTLLYQSPVQLQPQQQPHQPQYSSPSSFHDQRMSLDQTNNHPAPQNSSQSIGHPISSQQQQSQQEQLAIQQQMHHQHLQQMHHQHRLQLEQQQQRLLLHHQQERQEQQQQQQQQQQQRQQQQQQQQQQQRHDQLRQQQQRPLPSTSTPLPPLQQQPLSSSAFPPLISRSTMSPPLASHQQSVTAVQSQIVSKADLPSLGRGTVVEEKAIIRRAELEEPVAVVKPKANSASLLSLFKR